MSHCAVVLTWLTKNPGRQLLTSSFHPVDDEHWEDRAGWHIGELSAGSTFESLFYLLACKKLQQASVGLSSALRHFGVEFSAEISEIVCQV